MVELGKIWFLLSVMVLNSCSTSNKRNLRSFDWLLNLANQEIPRDLHRVVLRKRFGIFLCILPADRVGSHHSSTSQVSYREKCAFLT